MKDISQEFAIHQLKAQKEFNKIADLENRVKSLEEIRKVQIIQVEANIEGRVLTLEDARVVQIKLNTGYTNALENKAVEPEKKWWKDFFKK